MATKSYANLEALLKRATETYDYDAEPFGTFKLRNLTHGEVKQINAKYITNESGGIIDFQAFLDEITCLACVEPALTQDALDQIPDEDVALRNLALHIGRKCNILATPKDEGADPKGASADDATSTTSS